MTDIMENREGKTRGKEKKERKKRRERRVKILRNIGRWTLSETKRLAGSMREMK